MTQARAWQTLDEAVSGEFDQSPKYFHFGWSFQNRAFLEPECGFRQQNRGKIGIAATCAAGGRAGCNQAGRTGRFSGGSQRDGYCPGATWL
ncbi:hypothetical protein [Novosphingobium pokkalii]|uniref:Uncharacterized protein n=1 Tax=Novosphingobium pokkalii TaxID=1770194 RepID=A0ABV7V3B6_9SPHN|nr:hypothetical protein [Novosphingobium pokkalii]